VQDKKDVTKMDKMSSLQSILQSDATVYLEAQNFAWSWKKDCYSSKSCQL